VCEWLQLRGSVIDMKESLSIFLLGVTFGIFLLSVVGMLLGRSPSQLEEKMEKMRKEAISVGVGRYEVDTNGVVSFKWNK